MTLEQTILRIRPADAQAKARAWKHWDSIAKPLRSLGLLEEAVVQLAGIQHTPDVCIDRRRVVVMCADNGIVAQGVYRRYSVSYHPLQKPWWLFPYQ